MMCVAVLVVLVAINAVFVLLEESPHTSGAAKDVVVLVFALVHELVDHVMSPLIVSVVVKVAAASNTAYVHPSTVFVTLVMVEVVNSVLAPMIAQLRASEGCFRDELFSSPEPVETSISVGYCNCTGLKSVTEAGCMSPPEFVCGWHTYPVGVTYTPPFRFDGGRCISSIITLYSPEYIIIFALRILVYPVGWWLAHRGTPWAVTGIQPPVLLSLTFVRARRHMVRVITCCFAEQSAGDDTVSDTDSYADVATASMSSLSVPAQSSSWAPSSSSSSFALRSKADAVLETLHAIEPATHRFNLLVIVAGPGMFSPLVAVAGVASLVCLFLWQWALDRQFGTKGRHDETHDEHDQASVHAVHPMPLACVAILLLINTIYLVVLLSTSQLAWAGWTASVVSWLMFVVSCWWCWDSLCGTATQRTSTSRGRGHVEAPIELSEMLLPQQHEDEDADE